MSSVDNVLSFVNKKLQDQRIINHLSDPLYDFQSKPHIAAYHDFKQSEHNSINRDESQYISSI